MAKVTSPTTTFNNEYFSFIVSESWKHIGADQTHADILAHNLLVGGLQGKLHQGLGVIEAVTIPYEAGILDPTSTPELESEGDTWAVYNGKKSSGHYVLCANGSNGYRESTQARYLNRIWLRPL